MSKYAVLTWLLLILFVISLPSQIDSQKMNGSLIENQQIRSDQNINSIQNAQTPSIIHDGIVGANEYEYSSSYKHGKFLLYYTINRSTIYIAIKAKAMGYVAIGFEYDDDMLNSDIIVGYFDDLTNNTIAFDAFGATKKGTPRPDAEQNIISSKSSQDSTYTTLEFSRLLNTGDVNEDREIVPGRSIDLIYAYHSKDVYEEHDKAEEIEGFKFYGPPSSPTSLSGSSNRDQVSMDWTAPKGDGGFPILHYNVYRSFNSNAFDLINQTTSTSIIDTTIITGENYSYYITAENSKGESGTSNIFSTIPIDTMSSPINFGCVAESNNVGLFWDYPIDDGGTPITKYNLYRSSISNSSYSIIASIPGDLSFNYINVINGYTYYYVINAENKAISSNITNEVSCQPVGPSTSPLNLHISFGDNQVDLTWEKPLSDGGFVIEYYNIYRSPDDISAYVLVADKINTSSFVDKTVINAETYYYKVSATNSAGESDYSQSQRITLSNVPKQPDGLIGEENDGQVILNWDAANGMGYIITSYSIYRSYIGTDNEYQLLAVTNKTQYVDNDVTNGIQYTYYVTATNEVGEGGFSNALSLTPSRPPSNPQNLRQISIDNTKVKIRWDIPSINGGLPVSNYNIYRSIANQSSFSLYDISYKREYTDNDINPENVYYYKITAINNKGEGTESDILKVSVVSEPFGDIELSYELNNGELILKWVYSEPINATFNIYRSPLSGEPYMLLDTSSDREYIDTSVEFGLTYYYVISVKNSFGESDYSNEIEVSLISTPSVPRNLVALGSDQEVLLIWDVPENEGGLSKVFYNIFRENSLNGGYSLITNVQSLNWVDDTVENGLEYRYRITASNDMGESQYSNEISVIPQEIELTFQFIDINETDDITLPENTTGIPLSEFDSSNLPEGSTILVVATGTGAVVYIIKKKR